MNLAITLAIHAAIIGTAALLWQIATYVRARSTRIMVKAYPVVLPDKASWTVTCRIVNKGQHSVRIRMVRIANARNSAWYVDLAPDNGEKTPVAIESASDATFSVDGEKAATALAKLHKSVCVVVTSDDKAFRRPLNFDGEKFQLMCLLASLRVDDGSGSGAKFPLPADAILKGLRARELTWTLNFLVANGWAEKRISPDGESRYFITAEGEELTRDGVYQPQFDLNDIFDSRIDPAKISKSARHILDQ